MVRVLVARRVVTLLLDLPDDVLLTTLALVMGSPSLLPFRRGVLAWTNVLLVCKEMYRVGKRLTLVLSDFDADHARHCSFQQQVRFLFRSRKVPLLDKVQHCNVSLPL